MGLLATKPLADERLAVGAYIRLGVTLYRVKSNTPTNVLLEDAFLSNAEGSHTQSVAVKDVLATYTFVRAPRPL